MVLKKSDKRHKICTSVCLRCFKHLCLVGTTRKNIKKGQKQRFLIFFWVF